MSKSKGWIGVDFDGTLAHYDHWRGSKHVGVPIPKMVNRVKRWLADGRQVKIFTARASDADAIEGINTFCIEQFGKVLPITDRKDKSMVQLWDDRAVGVVKNTGYAVGGEPNEATEDLHQ